jgi:hypothetical protein
MGKTDSYRTQVLVLFLYFYSQALQEKLARNFPKK